MAKNSVIVFDLGKVLIDYNYSPAIEKLNRIQPGLGDSFSKLYTEDYDLHRKYERGEIHTEAFLDIMLERADHKLTGKQFCKLFSDVFTINQQVIDLLPILKKNYKLVLLSNTSAMHRKYGWGNYDFLKNFSKLVLSYEVGAVKPEKKIYQAVEEFTGVPAEKHLYIDDVKAYVNAAKKIGWDGILFKNYDELVKELKARKITLS